MTVQKFMTTYDLYGAADLSPLLENVGEAKFDLTAIAYNARPLVNQASKIKGVEIEPLIAELADIVESIRRILIRPALQEERLGKAISGLRKAYEKLSDTLAGIEFK